MRVLVAVALSLLVHALLWGGLWSVPDEWLLRGRLAEVAEIELVPMTDEQLQAQRLMVREAEPPRTDDDANDPARFLSASRRRVSVETQARETGLTQNNPRAPSADSWLRQVKPPARAPGRTPSLAERITLDGTSPVRVPRPEDDLGELANFRPSTVGERLPDDVSLGDITALNTDQFRFYSFFSRIEELVRFRWEDGLRRAIEAYSRTVVRARGTTTWTTRVQFVIGPDGRLISARVLKESGLHRFDLAAVQAFRDAAVFPNPPREMMSKDGTIKIDYAFSVRWDPQTLVSR